MELIPSWVNIGLACSAYKRCTNRQSNRIVLADLDDWCGSRHNTGEHKRKRKRKQGVLLFGAAIWRCYLAGDFPSLKEVFVFRWPNLRKVFATIFEILKFPR